MSRLLTRIRDHFCGPKLRNRAGGMAWIKPYGHDYGASAIAGQIVKTVRVENGRYWQVEPEPKYRATADFLQQRQELFIPAGTLVSVLSLSDDVLEPLSDTGITEEEANSLYLTQPKKSEVKA